jgi:hypothetical protein
MEPSNEDESSNNQTIFNQTNKVDYLIQWRDTAFQAAITKLTESGGKAESVLQTGEAFGRGLFSEIIQNKPQDWTLDQWLDTTINTIMKPIGTTMQIQEIGEDFVKTQLIQCPLHEQTNEFNIVGLFNYGFIRGLLRSAFPQGELLMASTIATKTPLTEFIFKANATYQDRNERERIKQFYKTRKLDE